MLFLLLFSQSLPPSSCTLPLGKCGLCRALHIAISNITNAARVLLDLPNSLS
jgi:hypothetical protein